MRVLCQNAGTIIQPFWCPTTQAAQCYGVKYTRCVKNKQGQCAWLQTPRLQWCLNQANSPPFVEQPCKIAGCNNSLCMYRTLLPIQTTCVWKPEYECYKEENHYTRCVYINGQCQWEQTSALSQCIQRPVVFDNTDSQV